MGMIHCGVRPKSVIIKQEDGRLRKTYHELLNGGGYKIWNEKLLNSGCGKEIDDVERDGELIYCPWCDEWFNKNQWRVSK